MAENTKEFQGELVSVERSRPFDIAELYRGCNRAGTRYHHS